MSAWLDGTIKQVRDFDAARPRSTQVRVGWSEVGDCRAYLGFRLDGAWPSDETDTWGAQRGTAIHEYLQAILAGPDTRTEVSTEYRGIPGHADLVEPGSVTDIKTTKLANSRLWQDDRSLLRPKRIQAHGYAAGLVDAGELPAGATVRLLVVPVDGTFADWWVWEEPFDRALADEGADRLEDARRRMADGDRLPKDKPFAYCQDWCEFFSLCRTPAEAGADEEITDPELAAAIAAYGKASARASAAEKDKKRLAPIIKGLTGTAGEWRISLTAPGEDKPAMNEAAVRADYQAWGQEIPEITQPGQAPKLSVRRINGTKRQQAGEVA